MRSPAHHRVDPADGQRVNATVIYVSYNTPSLDLSWIPDTGSAIIVHNDSSLDPASCRHPNVTHLHPGTNLGFGAAVNLALAEASTERVILCNPDTEMEREHFCALAHGGPDEILTVPMNDEAGRATGMVSPYWTPITLIAAAHRIGRLAPLGSRRRNVLVPLVSRWGREQHASLDNSETAWPLGTHWLSGALFSVDRERLSSIGGFDDEFFLYYEDADVCRRLHAAYPGMVIRQAACAPAVHAVGGSASSGTARSVVDRIRRNSATIYARRQHGRGWSMAARWLSATDSGESTPKDLTGVSA